MFYEFNPVSEVTDFLDSMVTAGWPIFLGVGGGLIAVVLATGAVRSIMRRVADLLGSRKDPNYYKHAYERERGWSD